MMFDLFTKVTLSPRSNDILQASLFPTVSFGEDTYIPRYFILLFLLPLSDTLSCHPDMGLKCDAIVKNRMLYTFLLIRRDVFPNRGIARMPPMPAFNLRVPRKNNSTPFPLKHHV